MTTTSRGGHRLGWRRSTHPGRLPFYAAPRHLLQAIPPKTDLRPQSMAPYDQGEIGSCTANSLAGCVQFALRKQGNGQGEFQPSRLFIYYNERSREQTIPLDAGASLADGIWTLQNWGACPEDVWPYVPTAADKNGAFPPDSPPATRPTDAAYAEAARHLELAGFRVQQTLAQLRGSLAEGYPVAFGFTMFNSFYDDQDLPLSVIPMPQTGEEIEGGHAVALWGHDDTKQLFLCRNSWGSNTQEGGYFWLPYAYVTEPDLASDFNTIRQVRI